MKPTLYFFKLNGCGACVQFEEQMFSKLVNDPEVRKVVTLEKIVFGRDQETGEEYSLAPEFPDFQSTIKYAPYVWLARGYDESQGYHLQPTTMHDKSLNLRQDGQLYEYRHDSTYPELRNWILQGARSYNSTRSGNFRSRRSSSTPGRK